MPDEIKAVEVAVTLAGSNLRADGSMTIRLVTALEATPELAAWTFAHHQGEMTALLTTDKIASVENVDAPPPKVSRKGSPSQEQYRYFWGEWNILREHPIDTPHSEMANRMTFEQYYPTRMKQVQRALQEGKI